MVLHLDLGGGGLRMRVMNAFSRGFTVQFVYMLTDVLASWLLLGISW